MDWNRQKTTLEKNTLSLGDYYLYRNEIRNQKMPQKSLTHDKEIWKHAMVGRPTMNISYSNALAGHLPARARRRNLWFCFHDHGNWFIDDVDARHFVER